MRLALLFVIVGVLAIAGLVRPKIGLMGYVWFALLRPDYLAWAPGQHPMSLVLAITTIIGALIYKPMGFVKIFSNPIARLILILQIPIVLSAIFAIIPALSFAPLYLYWRVIIMALLILVLIETKQDLIFLALVIGGSLGFLSGKMGLAGLIGGGARYVAGYAGMLSDNNTYALGLAMGMPLCWYLKDLVGPRWMRLGLGAVALLSIPGVLMTFSRGVAVAMGVGIILIAFRSRHKVMMGTGIAVFGFVLITFLGAEYQERISTVLDPTEEASANSRLVLAEAALKLSADYPLFGVGFGKTNQQRVIGNYLGVEGAGLVVHNTYLQVLADSGIFALIIFVATLGTAILLMQRSYMRWKKRDPSVTPIPLMIQTSLVVFAVDALVLSHPSFDILYMLLMMAGVWVGIENDAPAPAESPLVDAILGPSRAVREPLSSLPAAMPISRKQPTVGVGARQPSVGITTARQVELQQRKLKPGVAPR